MISEVNGHEARFEMISFPYLTTRFIRRGYIAFNESKCSDRVGKESWKVVVAYFKVQTLKDTTVI